MKKKNKKGFTLIELLAVIVILAVIALIAVPQVLKILNKARLSAAEDTVYGIVKSAETYVSNFMLKNRGSIPSENLVFNCNNDGCLLENISNYDSYELEGLEKLEFNGTKPKSGKVIISNNGNNITTTDLVINNFVCGYISGESICIEKGKIETKENGTVIYFNPETNEQCNDYVEANSDTNNKQGCMKWYIFNDSEESAFYNLLLDHNTTFDIRRVDLNSDRILVDTSSWYSGLSPRLVRDDEIENFNIHNAAWLWDRTYAGCMTKGCPNNASGNYTVYGYWVLSKDICYHIDWHGGRGGESPCNPYRENTSYGIRPVITVPKNKIA